MKSENSIFKNKAWENATPFISVVTPVYNRHDILPRALKSVEQQTYGNFEYIIVNDGSTENLDDVVIPFMEGAAFPVLYLKKNNGGVHSARNLGIDHARGVLITWLDSDDEFVPDTLKVFVNLWNSIPEDKKPEYYQISARCKNQEGVEGVRFPENINSLPKEEAYRVYHREKSENLVANLTSVMKQNKWPEPEGIRFVAENIVWLKLEQKYRTLFTNEILRIYHTEGTDHIYCRDKKKSLQYVKDSEWIFSYVLNHWSVYGGSVKYFCEVLFKYLVFRSILKRKGLHVYGLSSGTAKFFSVFFFLPCLIGSLVYERRKME